MLLNQFSVRVSEGAEQDGYVEMVHGQEYSLFLRNMNALPCDAEVEIDGKGVGAFRIWAHGSMVLEHPQNDQGRFTFAKLGTVEAAQGQLNANSPDLGLIKVTFTPGNVKQAKPLTNVRPQTDNWRASGGDAAYASASMGMSRGEEPRSFTLDSAPVGDQRSAGGTVLTGHSDQQFHDIEPLVYDYSRRTVIHLRLVSRGAASGARPLTSSTPVPPRIG